MPLQGDGTRAYRYEGAHGWRALVGPCWLTGDKAAPHLPRLAARLQAYYYTWLLPFERWLMHEHRACTATARVPAALVRRLAADRAQDCTLTFAVKYFAAVAEAPRGGFARCVAGRHDLSIDDGAHV